MTSDANKGIPANGISYNHLNLPTSITLPGGTISYTYDATGMKLQKKIVQSGQLNKYTFYAGNFIYGRTGDSGTGTLEFFSHPEGYISYDSGQFNYVYNYLDHLGNVRLTYSDLDGNGSISASTEILKERNYYPFGLEHQGYNSTVISENNFKTYQGKELEEELGLNTYDFGWRDFDPAIVRWNVIDPLAERRYELTPYNFVQNSPMFRIDPDGLTDFKLNKETGEVEQVGDVNKDPDRILKTDKEGNVKKKGEGFLGFLVRKSERGKAKVAVDGLKKGILEDGKNLKTESTMVEVNLGTDMKDNHFESSVLKISNYLDVELGGYYLNNLNDGKDYGYLDKFLGNEEKRAGTGLNFRASNMPGLTLDQVNLKVRWHTHLSRFDALDRQRPSSLGSNGGDLGSKRRALVNYPNLRFLIITNPSSFFY